MFREASWAPFRITPPSHTRARDGCSPTRWRWPAVPFVAFLALTVLLAGPARASSFAHDETSEQNATTWTVGLENAGTVGSPPPGGTIPGAHLLISEVIVTPTQLELIEITNPSTVAVSLDNYYLSDYNTSTSGYWALPTAPGALPIPGSPLINDWCVKFPAGATIAAGATKV